MNQPPTKRGGAPSAVDAERAMLGAILLTGQWPKGLERDLFGHPQLQQFFDLFQQHAQEGKGLDLPSLMPPVLAMGSAELVLAFTQLPGACPSVEGLPFWRKTLREARHQRRLYWWGREVAEAVQMQDWERVTALQQAPPQPDPDEPVSEALPTTTAGALDRDTLRAVKRLAKRKAAQSTLADTVLRNDPAWTGRIWWDNYRKQIMLSASPAQDADYQRISTWLDTLYRVKLAPSGVASVVQAIAQDHQRNPLQEYLRGIRWDQQPRLDRWLHVALGVADTELHRLIGRRWLIQAVARALKPGCKADVVLVLTGQQGIKKSTALRELTGGEYFSDSPIPIGEGPRGAQQVYTAWVHELSELSSLRGKAVEDVKSFITKTHDDFIPMYGRSPVHWARFCVFAGTTNEDTFLSDPTGARRFWPVRALAVDLPWLRQHRDQLWAEAVAAFEAGEPWWLEEPEEQVVSEEREQYQRDETWDGLIATWLKEATLTSGEPLTAGILLKRALNIEPNQHTTSNTTRIGQVMKRLGYAKGRLTVSPGVRVWVYTKEA